MIKNKMDTITGTKSSNRLESAAQYREHEEDKGKVDEEGPPQRVPGEDEHSLIIDNKGKGLTLLVEGTLTMPKEEADGTRGMTETISSQKFLRKETERRGSNFDNDHVLEWDNRPRSVLTRLDFSIGSERTHLP